MEQIDEAYSIQGAFSLAAAPKFWERGASRELYNSSKTVEICKYFLCDQKGSSELRRLHRAACICMMRTREGQRATLNLNTNLAL